MQRDSFVFRKEWRDAIGGLPERVRNEVYVAIVEYAFTGETPELKPMAQMAFNFVKIELDRETKRAEISMARAEAGRKGAQARKDADTKRDAAKRDETVPAPVEEMREAVNDGQCLKRFFRAENKGNIDTLMMQYGLAPGDTATLRALAKEVVAEWQMADRKHHSYSDWSQHLINTMRIKRSGKSERGQATKPQQMPKPADYGGSFGGKDV